MNRQQAIQAAFHKAAPDYDAHASQQCEVLEKLAQMAERYAATDALTLDVGCGTGYLKTHKPDWSIIATDLAEGMCRIAGEKSPAFVADMEKLPVGSAFDLIVNSLSLQWVYHKEQTFIQFFDALKAGAYVAISCYLNGSLGELDDAYKQAKLASPVQSFESFNTLAETLEEVGFELQLGEWEMRERVDKNLRDLLRYLRHIGAQTPAQKQRGLMTPRQYKALEQAYPSVDGKIISSWNIGYFIAKKPA